MGARGVIKGFLESRWGKWKKFRNETVWFCRLALGSFARGIRCDTGRREVEGRFVGNDK